MRAICRPAWLIFAVVIAPAAPAQTPTPSRDPLVDLIQTPRPSGPYSTWPEATRDSVMKATQARCRFMVELALGDYHGPKEARTAGTASMTSACIAHEMPDDWPGAAAAHANATRRWHEARVFDSAFPDPQILFGPTAPRYDQPPASR